jgi:hypothetical protein
MERNLFLHKVFILVVILAALPALTACKRGEQNNETPSTVSVDMEATKQPTASPIPSEAAAEVPVGEANDVSTSEFVSATNLFSLKVPDGWSSEEVLPGAVFVMANSESALERYKNGGAVKSGDYVINLGFLPLALLQENQLKHLGFQFEASPEAFLQSLLPMFRIGDEPAGDVAGNARLVSLSDGREAGMLTLSNEGGEGMILMFEAGDGVLAFVSTKASPGEMAEFQELTSALAAEVVYNGAQDALYGALYGGGG